MRSLVALALLATLASSQPEAESADLELVLAVDASSSIDIGEYALQLRGIAAGFRDPAVIAAIRVGDSGRVAVSVVVWAEQGFSKLDTGWHMIAMAEEAEAFAALVETLPRRQFGGTGIGEGLAYAVQSIAENGINAPRRVIDVSGDGRETGAEGAIPLVIARRQAEAAGITVNGLAVSDEDKNLARYFRERLIAGPGAFVIEASNYIDFQRAMRVKLYREISNRPDLALLR